MWASMAFIAAAVCVAIVGACDSHAAAAAQRGYTARAGTARHAFAATGSLTPPCDARWTASTASGINVAGAIAGSVIGTDTSEHPAVWTTDGLRDLGLPPGTTHAAARAVTASGAVVVNGWRRLPRPNAEGDVTTDLHAFVWDSGRWTAIEASPRAAKVYATAANNRGLVVGYVVDSTGRDRAFAWRGTGRPPSILEAGDGTRRGGASAVAVNDAGEVVGAAGHATAFVWRPGAAADTFDYLFRDPPAVYSAAAGVSDGGVVVGGVILTRSPGIQPFSFRLRRGQRLLGRVAVPARGGEYTAVSPNGALRVGHVDGGHAFVATDALSRALTAVPGFGEARPAAVNDAGIVVGTASLPIPNEPGPGTRAVAWDRSGAVRLLGLTPLGCAPGAPTSGVSAP